jgi:DNA polymerase-1
MCAMLRIESSERLKTLGFRQVLQVHDEIILEVGNSVKRSLVKHRCVFTLHVMICAQGPKDSVVEAQAIVKELMERPLPRSLLVDLTVDINNAETWYEAK